MSKNSASLMKNKQGMQNTHKAVLNPSKTQKLLQGNTKKTTLDDIFGESTEMTHERNPKRRETTDNHPNFHHHQMNELSHHHQSIHNHQEHFNYPKETAMTPGKISNHTSKEWRDSNEGCHSPDSDHHFFDNKTSKELTSDVRRCIKELKKEASLYMDTGKKKIHSTWIHPKKTLDTFEDHDCLETESKESFVLSTPASVEMFEGNKGKAPALSSSDIKDIRNKLGTLMQKVNKSSPTSILESKDGKPPALSTHDITDLKNKMDLLMNKMNKSEKKSQNRERENIKLKETVKELENKLHDVKMFHDPMNLSCNSKCLVF